MPWTLSSWIHINLNTIFYTYVEDSTAKTIYIRHYMETYTHTAETQSYYQFQSRLKNKHKLKRSVVNFSLHQVWFLMIMHTCTHTHTILFLTYIYIICVWTQWSVFTSHLECMTCWKAWHMRYDTRYNYNHVSYESSQPGRPWQSPHGWKSGLIFLRHKNSGHFACGTWSKPQCPSFYSSMSHCGLIIDLGLKLVHVSWSLN